MVVNWADSQTLWLNVLHAGLGVVTLLGLVAVAALAGTEFVHRLRSRQR